MHAKIMKTIKFGATLKIAAEDATGVKSTVHYRLCSVLVHHGHSTHSGHYVAYVNVSTGTGICNNINSNDTSYLEILFRL